MSDIGAIILCSFVLALRLSHGFLPVPSPEPSDLPVCIVGAGVTGLHLGTQLQAKGYRVEIFEQNDRVGGKASTYREGKSVLIEKGPLFFPKFDHLLLSYINRFQLTTVQVNVTDVLGFDPDNGSIQPLPALTSGQRSAFVQALQRYSEFSQAYSGMLSTEYLAVPPELFLPFSSWLTVHNLSILAPAFQLPVTTFGYGHLDDVPALYVFKYIQAELVPYFFGDELLFVLQEGLDVLYNKIAESLNVYLNHKVSKLIRIGQTLQEIHFDKGQRVRQCRSTVLAFPPLLVNLEKIIPDLSPFERGVLGEVRVHRYTSAGHHFPPLDHGLYAELISHSDLTKPPILSSPRGVGEIVGFTKQVHGGLQNNVYSSYSWIRGDFDCGPTLDDLQNIQTRLYSFSKKISPAPVTYFIEASEYFPHVTTNSLQNGFYYKFAKMQGQNGLYFATTLLGFEAMNLAMQVVDDFVLKYF